MKELHKATYLLLVIGGLNWLLAVGGWDIGNWFGGIDPTILKIIYVLVGLSAIYEIAIHKKICRFCNPSGSM